MTPRDGSAFSHGRELADAGRTSEAIRLLAPLAREPGPDRGGALATLGSVLLSEGRPSQARKAYGLSRRFAAENLDEAALWRRHALGLALADYEPALRDAREILTRGSPDFVDALLDAYVLSYRHRGGRGPASNISRAWLSRHLASLELLRRRGDLDVWALAYRGNLRSMAGQRAAAERDFAALQRLASGPDDFLLWLPGKARLVRGQPELAAACLRRAVRAAPRLWRLRCWLAEAYLCGGRAAQAMDSFQSACDLGGAARAAASVWEAEARLWSGDYSGALRCLDRAGASPQAPGWRGAAWLKNGRPEAALAHLDMACRDFPEDVEALIWRAETLLSLGRPREAVKDARLALMRSGNPWALVVDGLADHRLGAPGAARSAIARLRREFSGWWRAWGWRANVPAPALLESMLRLGLGNRRPEPYTALATKRAAPRTRPRASSSASPSRSFRRRS